MTNILLCSDLSLEFNPQMIENENYQISVSCSEFGHKVTIGVVSSVAIGALLESRRLAVTIQKLTLT